MEKGHDGFFHSQLGRGSYVAFRHLEAILRLTEYCEQNRPSSGAMTDEELERVRSSRL